MQDNTNTLTIQIPSRVRDNILMFLDRIEYKGLQEVSGINEILAYLHQRTPIAVDEQA